MHAFSSQGQPFFLAHFNTSRCPPTAAFAIKQVSSCQGHPFSKAYFKVSCLCNIHRSEPIPGQPFSLAHFTFQNVHSLQQVNKSGHSKGNHSLWPTSTVRNVRSQQRWNKYLHPKAPILSGPLQHFKVSTHCSIWASREIKREIVLCCPMYQFQISIQDGILCNVFTGRKVLGQCFHLWQTNCTTATIAPSHSFHIFSIVKESKSLIPHGGRTL